MRRTVCLAILALAACSDKRTAPKQQPNRAAADPWDVRETWVAPVPSWINDTPHVLRDKLIAVNAHVVVLKNVVDFAEYRDVLALAERTQGVTAAEPFIFAELELASQHDDLSGAGQRSGTVAIKGVDPARVERVLAVGRHMTTGALSSLASNEHAIILGDELARELGVAVGDEVTLTLRDETKPPVRKAFRVSGLFHVEFDEYDGRLALVPIKALQTLVGRGDQVMGIEMVVKDLERSATTAKALGQALGGPPYVVMDWYEMNKQLFSAMYGDRRP